MNLETVSSISQIIGTAAVMGRVVSVARTAMRTPQAPELASLRGACQLDALGSAQQLQRHLQGHRQEF